MHDIKYFFLNQNNQTIYGGEKIFRGDKLPKVLSKSTIFQNPEQQLPPNPFGSASASMVMIY
jgi:hypothetical protein